MLKGNSSVDKNIKIICLLVASYIVISMMSNISSLRIVMILTFSMDAGTLLYPITFTLRDLIHKKAGKDIAIFAIITAAIINLCMFIVFYIVAKLPADMLVGAQNQFGEVLIPGIRIVIGSIVAMLIAEFVDTFVYTMVVKKLGSKMEWLRVIASNGFSVPLDSIIFSIIAFYGEMPLEVLVGIVISNIIIKYLVTVLSVGSIYFVKEKTIK